MPLYIDQDGYQRWEDDPEVDPADVAVIQADVARRNLARQNWVQQRNVWMQGYQGHNPQAQMGGLGAAAQGNIGQMQYPWHIYQNAVPQGVLNPQVQPPDPDLVEDPNMKLLNPFLVGCDPEFVAIQNGDFFNVKQCIPQVGPVGWDHDGRVIELRPTPARSSHTLIKKMAKLFRTTKFPTAKLRAGAIFNETTLGGHVHLDVDADPDGKYLNMVSALDKYTKLLEDLDILPKRECHARRIKRWAGYNGAYGQWSDCKWDHGRMEYRTMASWLYSPITSYLCLTGAKLACAAPEATINMLDTGKVSSGKLIRFFEGFAETDNDAKRVVEKLLEPEVKLQRDPDSNLLDVWGVESKDLKLMEVA